MKTKMFAMMLLLGFACSDVNGQGLLTRMTGGGDCCGASTCCDTGSSCCGGDVSVRRCLRLPSLRRGGCGGGCDTGCTSAVSACDSACDPCGGGLRARLGGLRGRLFSGCGCASACDSGCGGAVVGNGCGCNGGNGGVVGNGCGCNGGNGGVVGNGCGCNGGGLAGGLIGRGCGCNGGGLVGNGCGCNGGNGGVVGNGCGCNGGAVANDCGCNQAASDCCDPCARRCRLSGLLDRLRSRRACCGVSVCDSGCGATVGAGCGCNGGTVTPATPANAEPQAQPTDSAKKYQTPNVDPNAFIIRGAKHINN